MKVKEESEKVGLKLNIQKTKIMASSPITSGKYMGKQWKQWETLFWGVPKSLQVTNLDSILKSRDGTLPTKVHLVKAMVFPVVMFGCESWTIKKAERRKIDAFKLWYWRRLFRVPWTAWRWSQSILKEINLEYSLEGLMLKLQYFGHLMRRGNSLEKTLMLGKTEDRRRRGQQDEIVGWYYQPYGHEFAQTLGDGERQGSPTCCSPWGRRVRHDWVTELNWNIFARCFLKFFC